MESNIQTIVINNKIVGHVKNKTYFTDRNPEKHFMRKYQGYGISQEILDKLFKMGVERVIIRAKPNEYVYSLSEFLNSGLCHNFEGTDFQRFVSIPGKSVNTFSSSSASKPTKQKSVTEFMN
jgi:hypothetical protein